MPALFIGRFQPFHKGHLEAIKWILGRERDIFIVIGSAQEFSTKNNPFSFRERKEMIEESLFAARIKNYKIFGVSDIFDDILWPKFVLKRLKIKASEARIFTKNPWTERCFRSINLEVKSHPIFFNGLSATQIRKRISLGQNWSGLVPSRVFRYLKRIHCEERIRFLRVLPEKRIISFIKERVRKSGAKGGVVGVSGGIDSSVVSFLAKKALGKKAIFLNMTFIRGCPLINNISILEKFAKLEIKRLYIGDIYQSLLALLPAGDRIAQGNLKARIRMAVLYYFANLYNLLVIGTTNRSEMEIGYFTKYGDGGVDIEPLGDLYKTDVIEMAKRLNLPDQIIKTIPTAGFWPGQSDEKEIGISYQNLDVVLKLLSQSLSEKEVFSLANISKSKVRKIIKQIRKNFHKLSLPPVCKVKPVF